MISIAENKDCMIAMAEFPDKFFDLAIVDPPYGINMSKNTAIGSENYMRKSGSKSFRIKRYKKSNWDISPPDAIYFEELFRVSKNQIIWGANHFIEKINKNSSCWIVWDKLNSGKYADCELAWTSFKTVVKKITYKYNGMIQGDMKNKEKRIHPTQKPVNLYLMILQNYAKPGDKILDTHLGSGSSRIAAKNLGFDFWGYEIDEEYFQAQEKRFNIGVNSTLFTKENTPNLFEGLC